MRFFPSLLLIAFRYLALPLSCLPCHLALSTFPHRHDARDVPSYRPTNEADMVGCVGLWAHHLCNLVGLMQHLVGSARTVRVKRSLFKILSSGSGGREMSGPKLCKVKTRGWGLSGGGRGGRWRRGDSKLFVCVFFSGGCPPFYGYHCQTRAGKHRMMSSSTCHGCSAHSEVEMKCFEGAARGR